MTTSTLITNYRMSRVQTTRINISRVNCTPKFLQRTNSVSTKYLQLFFTTPKSLPVPTSRGYRPKLRGCGSTRKHAPFSTTNQFQSYAKTKHPSPKAQRSSLPQAPRHFGHILPPVFLFRHYLLFSHVDNLASMLRK